MKNIISKLAIASVAMILALSCTADKSTPEPIWESAAMVVYANIGEAHAKSGLATMDISKLEQELNKEAELHQGEVALLKSIIRNPNASGFNLNKPIYFAVGEWVDDVNRYDAIASVEVESATAVDNFLRALDKDFSDANVKLEGNKRIATIDDEGVIIGYDDKRMVIIGSDDEACDLHSVLLKHMKYAPADMSLFNGYDAAAYLNLNNSYASMLLEEGFDVEQLSSYFNENASVVTGLSFDTGSLTYNIEFTGVSEEITKTFKRANASSLKLLEASPIAVLNVGVNGEILSDLANVAIDAAMAELGGASNEFNIYKNIALGVIASINGDMMFALSDAEGRTVEDYMGDEQLVFTTANALFTAEVIDDYIMKNIDTYGGGFLTKRGGKYSVNAFGNNITIAQNDKLFYVGVNNNGEVKKDSVANEEWSNNVVGSYLFAMVDFNELFKSGFGRVAQRVLLEDIRNKREREATKRVMSSIDRTYITLNGNNDTVRGELMITTSDSSKNSLQQIVELCYDLALN